MKKIFLLLCCLFSGVTLFAQHSPEEQAARQARSVHLLYEKVPHDAIVYYTEATVMACQPGTYIALIGFDAGYIGIQQLVDGRRIAIFSIWEPSNPMDFSADPTKVKKEIATRCLYAGEGVNATRFGGEGTGGKSMMDFDWQLAEKVRMAVTVEADQTPDRSVYSGWVYKEGAWFRMASFSSMVTKGKTTLSSPYSFVEDFYRNIASRDRVRAVLFSNFWSCNGDVWTETTSATFSADNNALTSIDAGSSPVGFWCATGGGIKNITTPLGKIIKSGGVPTHPESEGIRTALLEAWKSHPVVKVEATQPVE